MILVITINIDALTYSICEWLLYYRIEFLLVSPEDDIRIREISSEKTILYNNTRGYNLNLDTLDGVLFRQGELVLYEEKPNVDKYLASLIAKEKSELKNYIGYKLNILPHIGQHDRPDLNKLMVLKEAKMVGLEVPEYIFTRNKTDLIHFKEKCPELITKIIVPGFKYLKDDETYSTYTEVLSNEDVNKLPSQFHPTFFQQLVHKKFDIRMFYFNDVVYSVAILSQKNKKTEIDFRKYDRVVPNRVLSFELPEEIDNKVKKLVKRLSLSYCSIDMIYGLDKKFHFLEINPIGQFGVVSMPGNNYLEMKIANWFKEKISNV